LRRRYRKIRTGLSAPSCSAHAFFRNRNRPHGNIDATIIERSGRGTGEVVGLAQIPGQVGKNKPSARMPIEGLYLVGCDAGRRGVGTEQASDSALNVSRMILKTKD